LEPDHRGAALAACGVRLDPLLEAHLVLPLLERLRIWSRQARQGHRRLPLIGLNGPVGAGKSSLGRVLEGLAHRCGLKLMVASIDDLYLSWPERGQRLAGNPFGVTRVPPGSHDLPLLLDALAGWRRSGLLRLPRFDKTLAGGQGDRSGWREQNCDALVLEGWLIGCRPLSQSALDAVMAAAQAWLLQAGPQRITALDPHWSGEGAPPLRLDDWRWLPHWNRELEHYLPLWQACDGLALLRPLHWGLPRRWRFQAEARQRRAGGGWLQAHELDALVRASLCSLPPALYQDPLLMPLQQAAGQWWPAAAGGAVACLDHAAPAAAQPAIAPRLGTRPAGLTACPVAQDVPAVQTSRTADAPALDAGREANAADLAADLPQQGRLAAAAMRSGPDQAGASGPGSRLERGVGPQPSQADQPRMGPLTEMRGEARPRSAERRRAEQALQHGNAMALGDPSDAQDRSEERPGIADARPLPQSACPQASLRQLPPPLAVAWLDGRRRCRAVWLQSSLSSASAETG